MMYDHVIIGVGSAALKKAEELMSTASNSEKILMLNPETENRSLPIFHFSQDSRLEIISEAIQDVFEAKKEVRIETVSGRQICALKVWNSIFQTDSAPTLIEACPAYVSRMGYDRISTLNLSIENQKTSLGQKVLHHPFIFVSIFLITLNWTTHFFYQGDWTEQPLWIFPVMGLFVLGISHGAIDHLLNPTSSQVKFYGYYLLGFSIFLILWLISPLLALVVFIFVSGDHFGENQFLRALKISRDQFKVRILAGLWGISVSLIAPFFHWDETRPILQKLLRNPAFGEFISNLQAIYFGVGLSLLAVFASHVLAGYEEKALSRKIPRRYWTLLLCFMFWELPLIPGFLTFFCFWHSWDTIAQQKKILRWTTKDYLKRAAPYSGVATFFLLGTVYFFDNLQNIWSYLFLLLGALSVSHSFVMKRFYQSN